MASESSDRRTVHVEVLLAEGHRERFALPADSPLLRGIFLALGGVGEPMLELPLGGGRRALTVPATSLIAVSTEPPVLLAPQEVEGGQEEPAQGGTSESRSVERLKEHPPILIHDQRVVVRSESFPRFRKMAEKLLEGFERRREERRQRLAEIAERLGERTLAVATFNAGYGPMFENWAASCDRHKIPSRDFTVLFPTDEEADRMARARGFATYFDEESMGSLPRHAHANYGDPDFALAMFPKVAAVQDLLELGFDLIRQDMDLVWLEDPRPRLESLARADDLDMLFMRDVNSRFQPLYYNSGFVYVRNNELTRYTWKRIFEALPEILHIRSEQEVVNQIVLCHRERGLRTARLPDEYVDGELINLAHLRGRSLPDRPVVAHVSWTANIEEKVERLRGVGMWYLDAETTPSARDS